VNASPAISTAGLSKRYGATTALDDLNLAVPTGGVFGYLGPNGAGKTTTIRLLLDLIRPTGGAITVLGLDPRRDSCALRRRVGYLPGELVLYEQLTGTELLSHFGHLRGGVNWATVTRLADRLDIDLSRPIRALSKGNKQKLGLVQALMSEPELLILDEPTSGLDPLVQQTVHDLLFEARSDGRTVFLSSHVLSEVERIADRVGVLRRGRLAAVEDVEALRHKALRRVTARFARQVPPDAFTRVPGVTDVVLRDRDLQLDLAGPIDGLVKALARFEVVDLQVGEPDLEQIFLTFYAEEAPSRAA
jgi:beta-exotoxin I transport system ATP-binding protein